MDTGSKPVAGSCLQRAPISAYDRARPQAASVCMLTPRVLATYAFYTARNKQTNKNPLDSRNAKKGIRVRWGHRRGSATTAAPLQPHCLLFPPAPGSAASLTLVPGRADILQNALCTHTHPITSDRFPSQPFLLSVLFGSACAARASLRVPPARSTSLALQLMQCPCSAHCERRAEIRAEKTADKRNSNHTKSSSLRCWVKCLSLLRFQTLLPRSTRRLLR